ncbi:hypothetical protein BHM03_00037322 [Ensete ventricosum]|nr:hypothetical protein BHM03_00037322 [Ensete ventricosum]
MARPFTKVAGHGQAPCRGGWLWRRPPTKGRLAAASPYGRQPSEGTVACSATPAGAARAVVSNGSSVGRRGSCPLIGQLPSDKGSCRLRKGDTVRVTTGTIMPLREITMYGDAMRIQRNR